MSLMRGLQKEFVQRQTFVLSGETKNVSLKGYSDSIASRYRSHLSTKTMFERYSIIINGISKLRYA